jgi:hypothetical protein
MVIRLVGLIGLKARQLTFFDCFRVGASRDDCMKSEWCKEKDYGTKYYVNVT